MRVIAIDGPAGAGKSTIAAALAQRLALARLDTGAMYRAVTLAALRDGIDPADGTRLAALAKGLYLSVGERVLVDGLDATAEIRGPDVTATVSQVSAHAEVRAELVRRQRAWVESHKGQWNHGDWLALLDELKRSHFWPVQPAAVGAVLEEIKQERLRRN